MKSLKWRSFVVFVSIFFAALLVTFSDIYHIVSRDSKRMAIESANYEIEAAVKNLDTQMEGMKKTYYTADFSKRLIQELQKPRDQIDYQLILATLDELIYFSDNVYSIYLYDTANHMFLSTETMAWYNNQNWFTTYWKGPERELSLVHTLDATSDYNQMFSYIGEMKVDFFGETVALLSVNMLRHNVQQMITEHTLYEGAIQFILDKNGNVMAQSSNFNDQVLENIGKKMKTNTFISCDGNEYLYLEGVAANGTRYVKLIPEKEMFQGISQVRAVLLVSALFFGMLILLVTYYMLDYLTKPIYELSEKIRRYRQEDGVKVEFKTKRKDEFAYLFRSLEDMTDHIDYLIDELYKSDLYKKEMQLKLYRVSINPHFIFNILDSITWTLKFKDYQKVEKTLSRFADFFRASLTQTQDYVTMEDTKRWLYSYCFLSSFLKNDQIQLKLEVDEELEHVRIPSLLIQPVIENSFKYGFEGNHGGEIFVKLEEKDGKVCFTIRDDGTGMTREQVDKIMDRVRTYDIRKNTKHFGLASVYQRVRLLSGEEAQFRLSSAPGEGTEVYFEIKV